jgi:uncharacterized protein (DUF1778 family)
MTKVSEKRPNGPFDLRISERQRKLLVRALTEGLSDDFVLTLMSENAQSVVMGNNLQQLQELTSMLSTLPDNNVAGMLHALLHASER